MRLSIPDLKRHFEAVQRGKRSRHSPMDRVNPSIFQFDDLTLRRLSDDLQRLIAELPAATDGVALDLGSDKCPYRSMLEARGYAVNTLDLALDSGADYAGMAEETGLPNESFDLVLCTQVIEHCMNPWRVLPRYAVSSSPMGRSSSPRRTCGFIIHTRRITGDSHRKGSFGCARTLASSRRCCSRRVGAFSRFFRS